jgi:hypothetical protein
MISGVLAILLVLGSVALLLFLVSLLFNAAHIPLGRAMERRRFAARQERSKRGDKLLESGDVGRALDEFRRSFYLETIVSDRTLLGPVHNHHTGLLSRLIAVTDEVQGGTVRLMSLAKADRLLNERLDLHRRYFRARDGTNNGQTRELYAKLAQNRRDLDTCLQQLVAEISASRAEARVH